jgi:hypothetical protein
MLILCKIEDRKQMTLGVFGSYDKHKILNKHSQISRDANASALQNCYICEARQSFHLLFSFVPLLY